MYALHSENIRLCHEVDEAFSVIEKPKVTVIYSYFAPYKSFEACIYTNAEKREYQYEADKLDDKNQMREAMALRKTLREMAAYAKEQGIDTEPITNKLHMDNVRLCQEAEDAFAGIKEPLTYVIFSFYGQSSSFEVNILSGSHKGDFTYMVNKLDNAEELSKAKALNQKLKNMLKYAEKIKDGYKRREAS